MDAAIAGLLGTLVGAAISGGVAFGTEGLRARRERDARWLAERRAVYVRMIRLTRDQMVASGELRIRTPEDKERGRVLVEWARINSEIADIAEDMLLLGSDEVVKALEDQQAIATGAAPSENRGRDTEQGWLRLRDAARKDLLS